MRSVKSLYLMKKKPKQGRSNATVDAILQASTQLLISQGYQFVTTNGIAEKAGVSIGSVYEYFPGKEAIFAEVRRREDRRLLELVLSKPVPETVRDVLRLHVSSYLQLVQSNLALHAALARDLPQFATLQEQEARVSQYLKLSNEFFATRRNELRPSADKEIITEFMVRVVRSTINDYALNAPEKLARFDIEQELLIMLERYLIK